MELDDSFTEKLLQRRKARRKFLDAELTSIGTKRPALIDETPPTSGLSEKIPKESPKRQCLQDDGSDDKENIHYEESNSPFVPFQSSAKRDEEFSSTKASSLQENKCSSYVFSTKSQDLCSEQKSRLANLAAKINQWEDETTDATVKSPVKSSVHKLESNSCMTSDKKSSSSEGSLNEDAFDESYDFNSDLESKMEVELQYSNKPLKINEEQSKKFSSEKTAPPKELEISVDPVELPLSARKALFEKALLGGTPKLNDSVIDHTLTVAQRAAMFENATKSENTAKQSRNLREPKRFVPAGLPKFQPSRKSPAKAAIITNSDGEFKKPKDSPIKRITPEAAVVSPSKNAGCHTRLVQEKLIANANNFQQRDIVVKATEERKKEILSLVNHWEKLSSSSSVENSNSEVEKNIDSDQQIGSESESEEIYENADEVSQELEEELSEEDEISQEEVVSQDDEKDVPTYEETSEDEYQREFCFNPPDNANEQNCHNADAFSSAVRDRNTPLSSYPNGSSVGSSVSLSGVSSYSGESCDIESERQSGSHDYSIAPSVASSKSDEVFTESSEKTKNEEVPLLYTVSFYRKQKQNKLTPVRTTVHKEEPSSPESPEFDNTKLIQESIKALQEEIQKQQTVISQTSQALNLCTTTAEFSGSTEQVEGERLLLIATQKRQAYLNEIQRLKTCGAQGENIEEGTGTLIITDIQLPLKRDFLAAQLEGKESNDVHYFLCLIRHGAQVIVTQMMSTADKLTNGALCFTNHIKIQNLPADFSVVFEVYALQTKKENLPHEKKYHIKREHSKIRLTPKGKKDKKILFPAVSSPGGPSTVRSPSFGVIGYTRFTLANCNKTGFVLDKVPFTSPLDGVLKIKLQLHAEHKVMQRGFLTMFEDLSGFGAWQRRWCFLDGHILAYWKYPENEDQKEPIGRINLKQCVTGVVKLVSRDTCARPHTFQLVTIRPQSKGDKNTLISKSVNTLTTTKHLLSADTKDDRIMWCSKLNEALTTIRKWDPQALRPVESMQDYM